MQRIVVVGGGAGGLVLATKLGRKLGRSGRAEITLVDPKLVHVWKPLLHEIAAGTLNPAEDGVMYLVHASAHGFRFALGRLAGLDRQARIIRLASVEQEHGPAIPERTIAYDILVVAIGSVGDDFGVPGVTEHCTFLDSQEQAEALQRRLLRDFLRAEFLEAEARRALGQIAIIGGGATGVELAAELHNASHQLVAYGPRAFDPKSDLKLTLIEAAPRLLPALPEHLAEETRDQLERLGIEVLTGESASEVTAEGLRTRSGRFIPANFKIWCAGIRAPAITRTLDGLETNRRGQLVVDAHLRTTQDPAIYGLGDCAAAPGAEPGETVPPRAQAAYQEALYLVDALDRRLAGRDAPAFVYQDHGSLISLSYSAVGRLMGNLFGSVTIEGRLARWAYLSLYRKHQLTLHGLRWMILRTIGGWFTRSTQPRLKLH